MATFSLKKLVIVNNNATEAIVNLTTVTEVPDGEGVREVRNVREVKMDLGAENIISSKGSPSRLITGAESHLSGLGNLVSLDKSNFIYKEEVVNKYPRTARPTVTKTTWIFE